MHHISNSLRSMVLAGCGMLVAVGVGSAQTNASSEYQGMLWQVGGHVAGAAGVPSASFTELPGAPNCLGTSQDARFTGGSGSGFGVSAVVGLRPTIGEGFASHIGYALRVGYATSKTSFQVDESIGEAIDNTGRIMPVVGTLMLDATMSSVRIEPMVTYQVGPTFPLLLELGASLGMQIGGTFTQKEQLTSPSGARFTDGGRERNLGSGDIQDRSGMAAGISLGLAYDIPVGGTLSIRPEVAGLLALTSPVSGVDWSAHEVRFGLSVLYTIPPSGPTPLDPTGGQR